MFYVAARTQDIVQIFNPIAWLPINLWVITFGLLSLLVLLFPTGYALTPGWRTVAWLAVFSIAIGLVSADPAIRLGTISLQFTDPITRTNIGSGMVSASFIQFVSQIGVILSGIAAAASLVIRFRFSQGEERQQIKWFVYASVWLVFFVVISMLAYFLAIDPNAPYPLGAFLGIPNALTLIALPVATAMAILKYRLWDIDVIIRRTLIYVALTAILIIIYFASVVGLQWIFLGLIGSGSTLAVVVSTLTIAFLFNPLRSRVQSEIDRRFYRRRYNIDQTVSDFSVRLRNEVDLDQLQSHLIDVVRETIQPEFIQLWLSPKTRGSLKEQKIQK
jgi:hypothetical protein